MRMLFVIIEDYTMQTRDELYRRFADYTRPGGMTILGHYQLIGQQRIIIVCEAESTEALMRITAPWTDLVSMQIFPAAEWNDYYHIAYPEHESASGGTSS